MSHSLDRITGTTIKVESSNINEEVISRFKALSSYWPEHTEKDDHDPFQNIGYVAEANQSITVTPPCTEQACIIPVFLRNRYFYD